MRKHGWQLPSHPLQVVAVAVFLALGFAFYVFFAPFVGKNMFQYIVMGIYTPLITCCFGLYIWCAAADPADLGVFKSKKYVKIPESGKYSGQNGSKFGGDSGTTFLDDNDTSVGGKTVEKDVAVTDETLKDTTIEIEGKYGLWKQSSYLVWIFSPCAIICKCTGSHDESSKQQMSEDEMFYCSLCEVEVFKYSKHCRACDKCVDRFDHHCRWLNNCIGKRNYKQFFTLMVSALVLLVLQWSTGILLLICCFIEQKQFSADISAKLGSSFSLVPFVIVVALCSILAMMATLPLAQLFLFHILLVKKGISTYDYIIAVREQQGVGGQQSPQMSLVSSLTGLSSASLFSTLHRGAWCTPPRLFLEDDQFDVVPPDTGSVSSFGKKMVGDDEPIKKKNPSAVKMNPWTLARLNAEDVSKAAAEARKKSKTLLPLVRHEADSSGRPMFSRPDGNRRRASKDVLAKPADKGFNYTSSCLAPLQLEARSAFHTMWSSVGIVASSPKSSLESPGIHSFRISEEASQLSGLPAHKGFPSSRYASDGYEASGGEDSDPVPWGIIQRPTNWSNTLFIRAG